MFGQDDIAKATVVSNYVGPSIWVRIGDHFGPRLAEWSGSFQMLILGLVFMFQLDVFDQRTFVYFKAVFGTQTLPGITLFLFGFLGLIGLTVNGMRKEVTPWIRFSRAMVGFMLFTGMTTCFALSGIFTVWLCWAPVAAVSELVNMFRTSTDAGKSSHGIAAAP